jgi:nitrite reductase/ring-hydroxylating ferredoxin subunit
MPWSGWFLVAYERDLEGDVTAAAVGEHALVLVRTAGGVRAYDAACPHRGANLGLGGELEGDRIRCPFHGYRIGLGCDAGEHGFRVAEHETLVVGGLVFVRLGEGRENGFRAFMEEIDEGHYIVPGFALRTRTEPSLVVENAFDASHFRTVHGILNEPKLKPLPSARGEYGVEGIFTIPRSRWQTSGAERQDVQYQARAFSPWIVVSAMLGPNPYWVITGATPGRGGETTIRLSLCAPPDAQGRPPADDLCQYMLQQSRQGLEADRVIWENMLPVEPRLTALDDSMAGFQAFTRGFTDESLTEAPSDRERQ